MGDWGCQLSSSCLCWAGLSHFPKEYEASLKILQATSYSWSCDWREWGGIPHQCFLEHCLWMIQSAPERWLCCSGLLPDVRFSWTASGWSDFSQDRHCCSSWTSVAAWLASHHHTVGKCTNRLERLKGSPEALFFTPNSINRCIMSPWSVVQESLFWRKRSELESWVYKWGILAKLLHIVESQFLHFQNKDNHYCLLRLLWTAHVSLALPGTWVSGLCYLLFLLCNLFFFRTYLWMTLGIFFSVIKHLKDESLLLFRFWKHFKMRLKIC